MFPSLLCTMFFVLFQGFKGLNTNIGRIFYRSDRELRD
jgi:hypothetical protein